ncbi:tRNA lysidine(34) synthetase TilS [Maribacter sp. PR1]|uniref:tRNA(Ile)-lysidine synthase n=1 Tax=Maribacter cobaltidurans TaxID=1178778 RepID=A0ABU7IVY2_9FLAO|nr:MULTISPECIES: tRNA lysidine(34) synthetase TilS [Maribacter]MDC6389651.1 tRNA lysidine(34) synthetase TilS [Maribacter sp. PR1]MEE1977040.1 tRNA lysidine(34) synthetase TilS [Maribacter cobaltidurans]
MLKDFKSHISHNFPELLKHKFLLACSGGLDSVLLSYLCNQCGMDFILAHCNFRLRGDASDGDESFVKSLAKSLDKPVLVAHFDTMGYVNNKNVSVQMAARDLRYSWFKNQLEEHHINFLVTAHHADDNLETFLINLSRGTGIEGLTGIPANFGNIRRPLLKYSRVEISKYALEKNLEWREDESNRDTKYLRNKIRLEIVPKLKELHPTFLENFKRTQKFLSQTQDISENEIKKIKDGLFIKENGYIKIGIAELEELEPLDAYLYTIFQAYGFTEWDNVRDLLHGMSGKSLHSNKYTLLKNRDNLILAKNKAKVEVEFQIEEGQEKVTTPLNLELRQVSERKDNTPNIIYIDKNALKFPLTVRKWKQGDYFYPLGLNGKKKLSKFFKDEKMDFFSKREQWLLCSDNEIVWVIGRRADERFKVQNKTKKILRVAIL